MSLVYAKKCDEIGCMFVCVSRVSTCDRSVCGTEILDVFGVKNWVAMSCTRVYLLT